MNAHALIALVTLLAQSADPQLRPAPPAAPVSPAPPPAAGADTLRSPEVLPDRRVIFRLRAPRAAEVAVAGEWSRTGAAPGAPQKLARDGQGVWSLTVGPLPAGGYIYTFAVDGMTIADPVNPLIKLRARTSASILEVPGDEAWDFRDVPHGLLQLHTQAAPAVGGAQRQIYVYTPPGYEKNRTRRYPVVYLLHGNNDLAVGWTMAGKANLILDNLIATGRITPFIAVMPWGHALPFGTRPASGEPTNNDVFARYLLADVVPLIEAGYRLAPGRRNRAVVGLSMGGAQALQIALGNRERFGAVGMFGAGLPRAELEARYGQSLAAATAARTPFDLFFIGAGKEDPVLPRALELSEALRGHGVTTVYREVDGGHTYGTWRRLLVEAAPLLFKRP